jgi:superfamily I DNA/RNA helicase
MQLVYRHVKGAKLNSKTPLAQLENTLVMRLNVPVYVSLSDEEELSDALIRGKVCLTTFHASKGLERPVVGLYTLNPADP